LYYIVPKMGLPLNNTEPEREEEALFMKRWKNSDATILVEDKVMHF